MIAGDMTERFARHVPAGERRKHLANYMCGCTCRAAQPRLKLLRVELDLVDKFQAGRDAPFWALRSRWMRAPASRESRSLRAAR